MATTTHHHAPRRRYVQTGQGAPGLIGCLSRLGIKVTQFRPGDPENQGLVERANGYLATSFCPGRSCSAAVGAVSA